MYCGFVEEITACTINGWVYNKSLPDVPVEIVALSGDLELGRSVADVFRADLLAAGIGNGRHVFSIQIRRPLDRTKLRFRIDGANIELETAWGSMLDPAEYLVNEPYSRYAVNLNLAKTILADCLREPTRLSAFRLVGLMDAYCRLPLAARHSMAQVLSVGCGEALHEKYLALFESSIKILAVDIELRAMEQNADNIAFREANILDWHGDRETFDFAFSIECLEHIENYEAAFASIVQKVKPGGYIYISVPFANEAERADIALCQEERALHQHVTPGFSLELVEKLCADNGLKIEFIENMFFDDVVSALHKIVGAIPNESLVTVATELFMVVKLDLKNKTIKSRREAFGIRFLAQRQ